MRQFVDAVRGMGDMCRKLDTPVVSGNVSFYNETEGRPIHPTPTVAMVGLVEDVEQTVTIGFKGAGDRIALLGVNTDEIGGSEYLSVQFGRTAGAPPRLDDEREISVQRACLRMIRGGLLRSAHDCSEGGLAVALAECCLAGPNVGAKVEVRDPIRADLVLFGEAPSRIVISFDPSQRAKVEQLAHESGAPLAILGTTGGDRLAIADKLDLPLAKLREVWSGALPKIVS